MKQNIRIALNFATYNRTQLNGFAILVIVCLKNNLLFPTLPVSIADLTALQTALQDANNAAAQGGVPATTAANEARDAMNVALRQNAAYVQSLTAALTLSQIYTSGYDVVNTNRTQSPLIQPVLSGLDNSLTTKLLVQFGTIPNAKAYQVQFSTGTGAWQEAGIFPSTKNVLITSLTPGTIYNVRVRAIGGSTQYSEWSAPMPMMAN
ncbi:MAG TPA: fibronectin type III domain-containing protein [Verrucomicrobiae bacterium]